MPWYTTADARRDARDAEYIVELEPGVWACDVEQSDPGRVCDPCNAQRFGMREAADAALAAARAFRPFVHARVVAA
jgi:hypothetical protein